jgi:hypothetical protein
MADIEMCANGSCPLRKDCYRFRATTSPFLQSYGNYQWIKNDDGLPTCDSFWDVNLNC